MESCKIVFKLNYLNSKDPKKVTRSHHNILLFVLLFQFLLWKLVVLAPVDWSSLFLHSWVSDDILLCFRKLTVPPAIGGISGPLDFED